MNSRRVSRSSSLWSIADSVRGSIVDLRERAGNSLPRFASLHNLVRKAKKEKKEQKPTENGATASKGTEKFQNSQNQVEEQPLEVTYFCSRIKDQASIVLQLRPQEPPKRYGGFSQYSPSASVYTGLSNTTTRVGDPVIPRVPLRIVCVIDVSHSMAEPYGQSSMAADDGDSDKKVGVSKLDQVKMFTQLLTKSMGQEDFLSVVTFGTKAKVVYPLKKMTQEAKDEANRAIRDIEVGGVTNMAAGVFTAIEQFSTDYVKRPRLNVYDYGYRPSEHATQNKRYFDDNIILFTDGMANEGMIESEELLKEIKKKIAALKEECHYEKDYHVKITTLGTGGFLPELLFNVGQTFSSDAYYFLDENASMELNLMRPVLLRQNSIVTNVKVTLTALNGVLLNNLSTSREFEITDSELDGKADSTIKHYLVHDISADMQKHFCCTLRFPHKHKKALKGKEILKIEVQYTDSKMMKHSTEKLVMYEFIPKKESMNVEQDVVMTARQCCRLQAQAALITAATHMKKLNRASAKNHLEDAMNEIRSYCEYVANFLTGEENYMLLMESYVDLLLANLEHCTKFLGDYMVRWDDAWGRLMALSSSIGREVPTAEGIYMEDAELFSAPKIKEKLTDLCSRLRDIYAAQGLCTDMLDQHLRMVKELEAKLAEQQSYNDLM